MFPQEQGKQCPDENTGLRGELQQDHPASLQLAMPAFLSGRERRGFERMLGLETGKRKVTTPHRTVT